MFGWTECVSRRAIKHAAILLAGFVAMTTATAAQAETRTLKLYHVHLNEKSEITYKRNGKFLPDGLKKANWALRDWRESKPTNMDPKLLDLLWEAYSQSGSRGYIHIIGGYRSPGTNAMLRSRSSGVAGTSLHMSGKAVDWYLPDVPLKKLRDIGLKMQLGGVGYYPRSGSPFVHYDTGKGRYWPRMSRKELASVFPNGNTIHLPADGKPLPGYETALASYNKRKGSNDVQIASGRSGGGKSLLAMIFGGGNDEAEDEAEAKAAPVGKPSRPAAPARIAPEAEVQVAAVRPSRAAPTPPTTLPPGVPMPDRDSFDAAGGRRPATPPAALPNAPAVEETQVAALVPARVPLPTSSPVRPAAVETLDATLVAALEEEASPTAPGQLAYAVPMPRARPPFEAVLRNEQAALPTQKMIGGTNDLTPEAIIAASMPVPAEPIDTVPPVEPAPHIAMPSARPQSQIAAAMQQTSQPAEAPILLAALETPPARRLPAVVPTPTSTKGGRVVGEAPEPKSASRAAPAKTIAQRIEIASMITNPERRAVETELQRPVANTLISSLPTAVFSKGFSRKTSIPSGPQHFEGTAVNFLPVHKLD